MFDPLTRYLSATYLKIYIAPFVWWLVTVLLITSASHEEYVGLVVLSYVATFSLFGLVFYLTIKNEFETLQCYGVSFGRFAVPVLSVALALQASISVLAIVASGGGPRAVAYAIWAFLAVSVCCWITLKTIWNRRESAALWACLFGFAAQTALLFVWGIASLALAHPR